MKCRRCGHEPCPVCKEAGVPWCDVLLHSAADDGFVAESDQPVADDDWPVLCCGGECDYGEGVQP